MTQHILSFPITVQAIRYQLPPVSWLHGGGVGGGSGAYLTAAASGNNHMIMETACETERQRFLNMIKRSHFLSVARSLLFVLDSSGGTLCD